MSRASLDGLCAAAGLDARQADQLDRILAALEQDPLAPTTVREREQALALHISDSLAALAVEPLRGARTIADLGSGAGFPGLALAVALPLAQVALVESVARKCEYLERVRAGAAVDNATVVCARAEDWQDGAGWADVVTARALAAQPVVLEYAAPLLRIGGVLIDWRGARDPEEEDRGERACVVLGLERVEVLWADAYDGAREHHLHVFRKLRETPARFPRRAGIARKRPLGA